MPFNKNEHNINVHGLLVHQDARSLERMSKGDEADDEVLVVT